MCVEDGGEEKMKKFSYITLIFVFLQSYIREVGSCIENVELMSGEDKCLLHSIFLYVCVASHVHETLHLFLLL